LRARLRASAPRRGGHHRALPPASACASAARGRERGGGARADASSRCSSAHPSFWPHHLALRPHRAHAVRASAQAAACAPPLRHAGDASAHGSAKGGKKESASKSKASKSKAAIISSFTNALLLMQPAFPVLPRRTRSGMVSGPRAYGTPSALLVGVFRELSRPMSDSTPRRGDARRCS
jgi:hypothetical protein